ncbi:guanylate kinase [Microscilla marina]|uniref:Guanylate kinase n=1 Tax=Microscilla marina ATCC 23134 TaxID=313606 RepID=A1ZR70_MICM2|nr:guanylate kinase [Microscilla marina]EAY27159.1 guanylate kinase [Microscilla marina ATCC 23134]
MENNFSEQKHATPTPTQGKVIIFSAPSGSGKTTIVQHLLKNQAQFGFSVSACTRNKRVHETHGKDYYFLTVEEFKQKIDAQEFVEWEEVYKDNFYGTLKAEVEKIRNTGKHVLFDVDVKGGINLKSYYQNDALSIFVKVPSLEVLEKRLRARNTETEESLQRRLAKVKKELQDQDKFDIIVVNETLKDTLVNVDEIIQDFISPKSINQIT